MDQADNDPTRSVPTTFDIALAAMRRHGGEVVSREQPHDVAVCERDGMVWFRTGNLAGFDRVAAVRLRPAQRNPAWIEVQGPGVERWTLVRKLPDLSFRFARRPRLLLLLHDALSSTIGTFGQLCLTPWGAQELRLWQEQYDAILGFDHDTIKLDPVQNAISLCERLGQLSVPPTIDVIAHGRGGLVLLALAVLVSEKRPAADLRLGTLIGSPNHGTPLAAAGRQLEFARVMATLTAAVTMTPELNSAGVTAVAEAGLVDLAALLQGALGEPTPGFDAMATGSDLLQALGVGDTSARPFGPAYLTAVTATFDEYPHWSTSSDSGLARLGPTVLESEPSDLVVALASMSSLGAGLDPALSDIYSLGAGPSLHHLAYLSRPEFLTAWRSWQEEALKRRVRSGLTVKPSLSAQVHRRVLVIDPEDAPAAAIERIASERADYVIFPDVSSQRYIPMLLPEAIAELEGAAAVPEEGRTVGELLYDAQGAPPPGVAFDAFPGPKPVSANDAVTAEPAREPVVVVVSGEPVGVIAPPQADVIHELAELPQADVVVALPSVPQPRERLVVNAQAQVDRVLSLGDTVSVYVDLAREELPPAAADALSGRASAELDNRPLVVEIRAIDKLEVDGTSRVEVDPPSPSQPVQCIFRVRAAAIGEAELWVMVRQGVLPAITFKLNPTVVESVPPEHVATFAVASASASADADGCAVKSLLEITDHGDEKLRFTIRPDPTGTFCEYFQEIPGRDKREAYVKELYEQIEQRYRTAGGDAEAFQESLQEFGDELCEELLPRDFQEVLWKHRDRLEGMFVLSQEPFIPWELVHLKEPGTTLSDEPCFLGQFGVVRWLYGMSYPPCTLFVRPARSRYIIPRYADPELRLDATDVEREFLQRRFGAEPIKADLAVVKEFLKRPAPADLLHFAGHGLTQEGDFAEPALLMEGRAQRRDSETVYTRDLLDARFVKSRVDLEGEDGARAIVVLNACQTGRVAQRLTSIGGFADAFLRRGAGAFVASLWSVGDEPAATFTSALYDQLLAGIPMAEAVRGARGTARASGDGTWLAYTVYAHPAAVLRLD